RGRFRRGQVRSSASTSPPVGIRQWPGGNSALTNLRRAYHIAFEHRQEQGAKSAARFKGGIQVDRNNYPRLHNAAWPGVVGKGAPDSEPVIGLDTLLALTAGAEHEGQ